MTEYRLAGPLSRTRGVIGRYPEPGDRYVLDWPRVRLRRIHMIGVRQALDVEWWAEGELVACERLSPWLGSASYPADRVIEYPPI